MEDRLFLVHTRSHTLHSAPSRGDKDTVMALLKSGADDREDNFGWRALHYALANGRKDTAIVIEFQPSKSLVGGTNVTSKMTFSLNQH